MRDRILSKFKRNKGFMKALSRRIELLENELAQLKLVKATIENSN